MIAANSKRLFKNLGVENYINHKLCAYLTWDPYIDQTLKILSLCLRTPIFTKPNLCNLEAFFAVYFCLHSSISHKSAQYVCLHFSMSHKSAHMTVWPQQNQNKPNELTPRVKPSWFFQKYHFSGRDPYIKIVPKMRKKLMELSNRRMQKRYGLCYSTSLSRNNQNEVSSQNR